MQPIAHQFEITYLADTPPDIVVAANVDQVGDWMHFTDINSRMVFMTQKAHVKAIRRNGPVEQPTEDGAE